MAEPVAERGAHTRRWLEAATSPAGLFVSAVAVLSLFPVTSVIRDPDFWWHLRAGQLILAKGALLGTDPFTYTAASHAWTMHEWLTEVLFALMQRAGGLGLIVLVLSVVTWAGVMLILARAAMRAPHRFVLGAGLLLGVLAGYPIWGPRAQMLTFVFATLTLFLIERHLARGGRSVWWLVPVFLLWSNLHSGFVIGLGFIALVCAAEVAGRRLRMPDGADLRRVRTLAFVLLACTAVTLVNPNGPGILLYALQTQTSAAQQSLILEWHSPDFHDWVVLPFGVMMLSLAALAAYNRRMRARDAALAVATVALALQSVRHIALFVAAATPVWIDQASIALQRVRPTRPGVRAKRLPSLRFRASVGVLLAAVLVAAYAGGRLAPAMRVQPGSSVYAQEFPVAAVRWLAQAPHPLRIFNQYGEGGYIADQLSARGDKVFIFGDAALMGDQLLYSYAAVEAVQPTWDSIIRGAGTDVVLFDASTPLADVLAQAPDWKLEYRDSLSVIYAPRDRLAALQLPPSVGVQGR
ncbi:MAG: hypothetical protein JOZ46_02785 [Candidatus Dormibacteraeota bacterium]|nr:hypothetical protein [Candidatus Dormibacteraeota bacterium]